MDWSDREDVRREAAELRVQEDMEAAGHEWNREDCE